ncbi:heparinase II/III family protein [Mangrovibacterium sp.]|uniref:heparinase II/III domain-containing protein n=1 Tax=Mangrovibacterium sp. TaxID=1961364 RepID=UPI003563DBD4
MKKLLKYAFALWILAGFASCQPETKSTDSASGLQHPTLLLKKQDVATIRDGIEKYPLLKESFEKTKETADLAIESGIVVPFPKDPGGGYTHEKHKQNYTDMYSAGIVYQLTGDEKYAVFVKDMLVEYAKLYPTLGIHPEQKNQAPGKLFWQGLNESVWLVYTIQAYDCIYDFLSPEDRSNIETNLFHEVVKFFTVEDPYSFDRVHNHGTWCVSGVGMTGIVLGDSLMVQQALYSTKLDGSGGFLKQINDLFSPDGYYAEGPYYQRYALLPFIVFAQTLKNNLPETKIFEYKNGVLLKAVTTLLQMTNTDGRFYPINDAIKEKSWISAELIFGTNIAYAHNQNAQLLDVVQQNEKVMLSIEGLEVAKAIAEGKTAKFERTPMLIHDGANGDQGGLAMLRTENQESQTSVLFKFSSQGMGHGHFDRLAFMLYDQGQEIIPDYGAARYLNVEAKQGGRYLPENYSWAKQTVAHNTMLINEQSNYNGDAKLAEESHPELSFIDLDNDSIQIVSATDSSCYQGAVLNRTMALLKLDSRTYLIDLFKVANEKEANYDLPVYFNGQVMNTNFDYKRPEKQAAMGSKNGYQHLWVEAEASNLPSTASVCWMNKTSFYTMSVLTSPATKLVLTRLGANDPDFNLRNLQGMMIREPKSKNLSRLVVYEVHGNYNPVSESVMQSEGSVKNLSLEESSAGTTINIELKTDKVIHLQLDAEGTKHYKLIIQ